MVRTQWRSDSRRLFPASQTTRLGADHLVGGVGIGLQIRGERALIRPASRLPDIRQWRVFPLGNPLPPDRVFPFLLIRPDPAVPLPGTPLGLVYRSRFAGEHHRTMSIRREAVALAHVAVCLGMLYADQALGVLPPTTDPPGPV